MHRSNEIRWGNGFPDRKFKLIFYQCPHFCRDRISKGGWDLVFVKQDLIVNNLQSLKIKVFDTINFELSIYLKKWCTLFGFWMFAWKSKQLLKYLSILTLGYWSFRSRLKKQRAFFCIEAYLWFNKLNPRSNMFWIWERYC